MQRSVPMPTPPAIDDFQRALLLEQQALCAALVAAGDEPQELLAPLVADLYAILRSPIFPKKGYLSLANILMKALASEEKHIRLHGVLASPTALKEVHSIVQCATIFKRHGFKPRLTLWLARWENLIEIPYESAASRALTFSQQTYGVAEVARHAGFADAVIPIDIEVDGRTREVLHPLDVRDWLWRVLGASANQQGACPVLARDVAWCSAFHARQASLSRLGEQQALFDLALRRSIGQRVSAAEAAEVGEAMMVTLELHKRFLPCYGASLPIINLDGRTSASSAAAFAVA